MQILGHRGAAGYEPENTLRSFRRALALNVDGIELDVHCCRSGELVVIHDRTVDRTTNGTGEVAAQSYDQLRSLDAGQGEVIPTLNDVCQLVNKKVLIQIELKGGGTAIPTAQLIKTYVAEHHWPLDTFFISSFDHQQLMDIRTQLPTIGIGLLFHGKLPSDFLAYVKPYAAQSIHISRTVVSQPLVKKIHEAGYRVLVYTVNSHDEGVRLRTWGVEGVTADYPDLLMQ